MAMNVGYLRVSTENQTEKYGLDMQQQAITDYCKKNKIKIEKWYVDGGFSGKKLERPAMEELLADCESGLVGTVYTYKLDRMSRNTIDTLNLLYRILPQYNVKIVSMSEDIKTDTPMDRVFLTMNAAMSQYEREIIRARMTAGMRERVKTGKWRGGGNIPFGYRYDRNDGTLHIYEPEAKIVRMIFQLYREGYSDAAISDRTNGQKRPCAVHAILKNSTYTGMAKYQGVEYPGLHKPIISPEEFEETQRLIKRRSKPTKTTRDHLLVGLLYCKKCGAKMRYQKWGSYDNLCCYSHLGDKKYLVTDPNCDNLGTKAAIVEKEVVECFKRFALSPDTVGAAREEDIKNIRRELDASKRKLKRLYTLFAESDSDVLADTIAEEEKTSKLLALELERETIALKKENPTRDYRHIADVWDTLTIKDKQCILRLCIDKILVYRDDIEIHFITN